MLKAMNSNREDAGNTEGRMLSSLANKRVLLFTMKPATQGDCDQ